MDKICVQAKVTGRVQGVFFRDSTSQHARSLQLTGWVRNVEDGSVELVACGERSQVETLLDWLKKGPPLASVDNLDYQEIDWQDFDEFTIR